MGCPAPGRQRDVVTATLISIIGPPAVGKTTLAEALAAELPADVIREDYAGNPFLSASYVGRAEARLPGQLYFLMSRVKQLAIDTWPAAGYVVSDYGFCQDRVYARLRLGRGDHRLYRRVADRLEGLVHPPQWVVHLDASEPALLERIARRGRDHERVMTAEFLAAMRQAYAELVEAMERSASSGVIRVDGEHCDVRDAAVRAGLVETIRQGQPA